ncbi:MAG: hypothetical protein ACQETM_11655, partial [Bacteroidota bacterium]
YHEIITEFKPVSRESLEVKVVSVRGLAAYIESISPLSACPTIHCLRRAMFRWTASGKSVDLKKSPTCRPYSHGRISGIPKKPARP